MMMWSRLAASGSLPAPKADSARDLGFLLAELALCHHVAPSGLIDVEASELFRYNLQTIFYGF